ncbi:MAG: class I SAM-dependent methyltransferase, partial [Acidobacteria bacterium]|nr:class I SAM-dependent methyltransferase [Acidobacteriota bacterium]
MQRPADAVEPRTATIESGRDLRTQDFATPDAEPVTVSSGTDDETDPLPNRRYTSILFWKMVNALDASEPPARILDLGPTSHANMHFWAERGFRVSCYDLEKHEMEELERAPITNLSLAADRMNQRHLPFEDAAFAGICAWNCFSRLPFVSARRYIRECNRLLRSRGILHAIFLDAAGRLAHGDAEAEGADGEIMAAHAEQGGAQHQRRRHADHRAQGHAERQAAEILRRSEPRGRRGVGDHFELADVEVQL